MPPTLQTLLRSLCAITLALALSACSKGIDRALVTGDGQAAYRASLDRLTPEATPEQLAAFNWAVSDMSIELLHSRYPNASPRRVVHGEAERLLKELPLNIERLQAQLPQWQAAAAQAAAVDATDIVFELKPDFFGLQPVVTATVHNRSALAFARYGWTATLYLGDATEPVARTQLTASFAGHNGGGGLDPGARTRLSFQLGFVSGDPAWKTLAIQRATKRTVKLVPDAEAARDLSDHAIVGPSPQAALGVMVQTLQTARQARRI